MEKLSHNGHRRFLRAVGARSRYLNGSTDFHSRDDGKRMEGRYDLRHRTSDVWGWAVGAYDPYNDFLAGEQAGEALPLSFPINGLAYQTCPKKPLVPLLAARG